VLLPAVLVLLAQPAALDDERDFNHMVSAYETVQFERALFFCEKLLGDQRPDEDRARLLAFKGTILFQLNAPDAGRVALRDAVTLDAGVRLPRPTPPAVQAAFDEICEQLRPPPQPLRIDRAAAVAPPAAEPAGLSAPLTVGMLVATGATLAVGVAWASVALYFEQEVARLVPQVNSSADAQQVFEYQSIAAGAWIVALSAGGATLAAGTVTGVVAIFELSGPDERADAPARSD
jgi:hypothetical protein